MILSDIDYLDDVLNSGRSLIRGDLEILENLELRGFRKLPFKMKFQLCFIGVSSELDIDGIDLNGIEVDHQELKIDLFKHGVFGAGNFVDEIVAVDLLNINFEPDLISIKRRIQINHSRRMHYLGYLPENPLVLQGKLKDLTLFRKAL